jgi:hypothetical protein
MTEGPIVIVEDDKDDQEIYAEATTCSFFRDIPLLPF